MNMLRTSLLYSLCLTAPVMAADAPIPKPDPTQDKAAFERAAAGVWQEVFSAPCTGDWRQQWFLDDELGSDVVKATIAANNYKKFPDYGQKIKGHIIMSMFCYSFSIRCCSFLFACTVAGAT